MNEGDPRAEIKRLLIDGRLDEVMIRAASLHGHYCPGLAFGVKAGHTGLRRLGFENTGMEELIAVTECNNCFVDGVQMSTGCSLGNNALVYRDVGKTAVTIMSRRTNAGVRIALRPRRWESDDASDRQREGADLFRRVVKERRNDPEAARRLNALWRELSFETLEKPEDVLFDIRDVVPRFPEYAPIFDSETCGVCGEEFMGTKAAPGRGEPVCLDCAGTDCLAVIGRGICTFCNGTPV